MARPKTARLQTAYDLGHEHGRTGSRPHAADDVIGGNPDLQQAYDDGLQEGTDSLDTGRADEPPTRPHRPQATSRRRTSSSPTSSTKKTASRRASTSNSTGRRFSHPLHWGSGARGHVVGRPRLTPPRGVQVRDWTGFGFGLFLYALGSAYISYGPGGPTAWLRAKFINDTSKNPAATTGGATPALPTQPQTRTVPTGPGVTPQLAPTPTPAPTPQATS